MKYKSKDLKRAKEIITKYRTVFNTGLGRWVLADILEDLHFFNPLKTEEEMTLSNYGKTLLRRLGIFETENKQSIVDSLLNISWTEKEEDSEED